MEAPPSPAFERAVEKRLMAELKEKRAALEEELRVLQVTESARAHSQQFLFKLDQVSRYRKHVSTKYYLELTFGC